MQVVAALKQNCAVKSHSMVCKQCLVLFVVICIEYYSWQRVSGVLCSGRQCLVSVIVSICVVCGN